MRVCFFAAFLGITSTAASAQTVLFVDDDSSGATGTSWEDALQNLEDALEAARTTPTITEIRIAQGTYVPVRESKIGDPRSVTFEIPGNLSVLGGYAGVGAEDPSERDVEMFPTILSGDLNGDDSTVGIAENAFHIVKLKSVEDPIVLDGLVFTAGNADGRNIFFNANGAGLFVEDSTVTIRDCSFHTNFAGNSGAALVAIGAVLEILDCEFRSNSHNAISLEAFSFAKIDRSAFVDNSNGGDGGAMKVGGDSRAEIQRTVFVGNSSGAAGGGLLFRTNSEDPLPNLVLNCLFVGNHAERGGGLKRAGGSRVNVVNSTFVHNTSTKGPAGYDSDRTSPRQPVTNCVLWNNKREGLADEHGQIDGSVTVTYSCVQGWESGGTGNISAPPLFLDEDGEDNIPGNLDDNLRLGPGSPSIDAGVNSAVPADVADLDGDGDVDEPVPFDLDGNPRFVDDPDTDDCTQAPGTCGDAPIVDMGAFEFQPIPFELHLDIKPGGCPNALNRRSRGVLPVALLGTADFDVNLVDVGSVRLSRGDGVGGEVSPSEGPPGPHSVLEDVGTPFEGEACDCHELGGDGIDDLSMVFASDELVEVLALNDLPAGEPVELVLTFDLLDGTTLSVSDCIHLVGR